MANAVRHTQTRGIDSMPSLPATTRPLGIGVIGCGEIAQIMHLPFLHELPELSIAAVCDLSASTVDHVGEHYGVRRRSTDYRDVLADPAVEAVVVSTYDHAAIVAEAIDAGRHVLVEKPLAFTPAEARPLVDAAARAGVVALVGYMKLYDPGFELGLERIRAMGRPRACQVHDFAGRFDRHDGLYSVFRGDDVPADGRLEVEQRIVASVGARHAALYTLLLMLGSHDLALLRTAFGTPEAIAYAQAQGSEQLLAVLELAGGVPCVFELGVGTRYEWWDEWLSVHGEHEEVRVEFANPYVRYAPTEVRIREPLGDAPSTRVVPVSPDPPFRREWLHFADCIRRGAAPRTPLADGLRDLELAQAMIAAIPTMEPVA
jgi:predicted dehydrogenase